MIEVLNKEDIKELKDKLIKPFSEECLTPVGYDLRVGKEIILLTSSKKETLPENGSVTITPGEKFAVESLEKIILPNDMFAFIFGRIKLAWQGFTSLGTKVDPAFNDNLLLIFSNESSQEIELRYGDKICNIMFFRYENPPKDIEPRMRPFGLVIPAAPPPIRDPVDENQIRLRYGYGILSVIRYVKPKLRTYKKKIRELEKFKSRIIKFAIGILSTVIAGIIVWLVTR